MYAHTYTPPCNSHYIHSCVHTFWETAGEKTCMIACINIPYIHTFCKSRRSADISRCLILYCVHTHRHLHVYHAYIHTGGQQTFHGASYCIVFLDMHTYMSIHAYIHPGGQQTSMMWYTLVKSPRALFRRTHQQLYWHTQVHTYIHTYMHTYMHTRIHIHT